MQKKMGHGRYEECLGMLFFFQTHESKGQDMRMTPFADVSSSILTATIVNKHHSFGSQSDQVPLIPSSVN